MTLKDNDPGNLPTSASAEPSALQRWSNRKNRAKALEESVVSSDVEPTTSAPIVTDADMPPLESLTEDADYSGFLSAGVSEGLRRLALRKLFHSKAFNVIDGLDDYAEDFTHFAKLGNVVTQDMRHGLAVEAERIAQSAADNIATRTPDRDLEVQTPLSPESTPDPDFAMQNEASQT
jgi:hypothetical protein